MEIPFYQLFNVHQIRSFLRGLFSASFFFGHIAPKTKIKLCQRKTVGTTKITKHLEITLLDLATSPQAQPMVFICLLTSEIRQNLPVGFVDIRGLLNQQGFKNLSLLPLNSSNVMVLSKVEYHRSIFFIYFFRTCIPTFGWLQVDVPVILL